MAKAKQPLRLNLGCANLVWPGWKNLDINDMTGWIRQYAPDLEEWFQQHDITTGLPFPDQSTEAILANQVLDHLDPISAQRVLEHCHRVLQPGGVLRVVVEDFELLMRMYFARRLGDYHDSQPAQFQLVSEPAKLAMLLFGSWGAEQRNGYTGHRFAYTQHSLTEWLVRAGFAQEHVYFLPYGISHLQGMPEMRHDTAPEHSIICEAVR